MCPAIYSADIFSSWFFFIFTYSVLYLTEDFFFDVILFMSLSCMSYLEMLFPFQDYKHIHL